MQGGGAEEVEATREGAERALAASEARLRALLQVAVDGIVSTDHRGVVQMLNPAAERLFGYAADEVVGRNVSMLMPQPYQAEHDGYIARYLATGQKKIVGIGREVVGLRKDGTTFPMDLSVAEAHVGDDRVFVAVLRDITERKKAEGALREENVRLREYVERVGYESARYRMIGAGPAMRRVARLIEKVAPTDATVIVRGPSGTGKELVARALHFNSPRRGRPLVTVNCAALQESLLESELFGHEKGTITGAVQAKPGLIEVAEGGTLFIDEVAETTPALQAKLLRVLEDGHYRRVGSTKEGRADVRVIAATNKSLEAEQREGRFREDLYYRLNVVSIDLPPLRERREDIPDLVEHFLTTRQLGKARCHLTPQALQAVQNYRWPGNIRELANVLERAQILAENHLITLEDLPEVMRAAPGGEAPDAGPLNLNQQERQAVLDALRQAGGNKVHAARLLGVSRRALYRLIEHHGLGENRPGGAEGRDR